MSSTTTDGLLPADAADDIAYVQSTFRPMTDAGRSLAERGLLPRATYVLPDGTQMVPPDHDEPLEQAGGDETAIAAGFRDRFLAAGGDPADAEEEYVSWLSGHYGACLRATTPEAIVAKDGLMRAIEALLARPAPQDAGWRAGLRGAVDALDGLERPFARYDRERFGGPVSRDRLVAGPRERFPEVWGGS